MRDLTVDKDFGTISKMLNHRWKQLTEVEKEPYRVLAVNDMARYKREILEFYQNGFYHEEPRNEVLVEDPNIDFMQYQTPEQMQEMQMYFMHYQQSENQQLTGYDPTMPYEQQQFETKQEPIAK